MAIRLNGNTANYLSRSSDLLDYNSAYTLMAWVRPETVSGNDNIFVLSHLTNTAYDACGVSGGVLYVGAANGSFPSSPTGSTLSAGTYRHLAMVRVSTTELRLYLDGVLDITDSTTANVSGRTAIQRMLLGLWQSAGFGASDPYDGRYAYVKAWQAQLSAGEIAIEMAMAEPGRAAGLYGFWPMEAGSTRSAEFSGSGRVLTENGTLTDEAMPSLVFGAQRKRVTCVVPAFPYHMEV